MENDRTIRRLTALTESASTARVLNLLATHRRTSDVKSLETAPFFETRLLDRSIILKHRVRPHEYAQFSSPRPVATKILVPIDGGDLRVGARSAFVGQRDFDQVVEPVFGDSLRPGSRDRSILEMIDTLPSLDPFLLREHLRANGVTPARAYFAISDADLQRMFDFVRKEVMALVGLSAGDGQGSHAYASRLVEKLLSTAPDSGFEPLKATLRLNDQEYLDGIFSWRGFLYYKWALQNLSEPLRQVMGEIAATPSRGARSPDAEAYLPEARQRLSRTILETQARVQAMLDVYNKAYTDLTVESKPTAFRDFLLSAPQMFLSLGEQLGAIQHIVSFWRYRFPANRPRIVGADELMDVFLDFEDSLALSQQQDGQEWSV